MATLRTDSGVVNVTEKRKRRSKSVGSEATRATPTNSAILLTPTRRRRVFRAHKKPMRWPEIRDLARRASGRRRRSAAARVARLVSLGRSALDARGAYQLADSPRPRSTASSRRGDRGRLVLIPASRKHVAGAVDARLALARRRYRTRARSSKVRRSIAAVTARSEEPVIGRAVAGSARLVRRRGRRLPRPRLSRTGRSGRGERRRHRCGRQ